VDLGTLTVHTSHLVRSGFALDEGLLGIDPALIEGPGGDERLEHRTRGLEGVLAESPVIGEARLTILVFAGYATQDGRAGGGGEHVTIGGNQDNGAHRMVMPQAIRALLIIGRRIRRVDHGLGSTLQVQVQGEAQILAIHGGLKRRLDRALHAILKTATHVEPAAPLEGLVEVSLKAAAAHHLTHLQGTPHEILDF
jgi:hypothetical protein